MIIVDLHPKSKAHFFINQNVFIDEFYEQCIKRNHMCYLMGQNQKNFEKDFVNKCKEIQPDWILSNYRNTTYALRCGGYSGKIIEWNYDMHVYPQYTIDYANKYIDLWLMRWCYANYVFLSLDDFSKAVNLEQNFLDISCEEKVKSWIDSKYGIKVEKDYFLKQIKTKHMFFPHSISPSQFKNIKKDVDVCFIGCVSQAYPLRVSIFKDIKDFCINNNLTYIITNQPPNDDASDINRIINDPEKRKIWKVGEDYFDSLSRSKIFIFSSGFTNGFVQKYVEGLMAGCLVMANEPFHAQELGLVDKETYVIINEKNWKEKILFYLNNNQELERISKNGQKLANEKHTNVHRINEMLDAMEKF